MGLNASPISQAEVEDEDGDGEEEDVGNDFHNAAIVTSFEESRAPRVEAFDRVHPSRAAWFG